jgi:hypothetical protein
MVVSESGENAFENVADMALLLVKDDNARLPHSPGNLLFVASELCY